MTNTIGSIDGPTHLAAVQRIAELEAENERLRKLMCEAFYACSEDACSTSLPREFVQEAVKDEQRIGVDHILAARDAAQKLVQKLEAENERLRREVQHYKNIAYNNYF